jgi:hypothetical protein
MKVSVSFCQGEKIGRRRLYSTKRGVNNLKIFLIEGTVFGLRVREDFSVTSILPYTGSLISKISSSVNKSLHRPNKLSLDFIGPFEVISHNKNNDVTTRNLVNGNVREYHVERLKPFFGSRQGAIDLDCFILRRSRFPFDYGIP